MKKLFGMFAFLIMNVTATANAGVLYDAGPVGVDTGRCVAETCLGNENWWAISGFTADTDWNITGFEFFANDIFNAGVSNYESTSWQIISSDDPYGTALFSGDTTGTATITTSTTLYGVTNELINVTSFLLSGLDINLASGDYYLAQHHNFSVDATYTVLATTGSGENWYHTDYTERFTDDRLVAQKIFGTVASVPEPAMIAILGLGLLGLGYRRQQKRK
jgi:hypothetical protein